MISNILITAMILREKFDKNFNFQVFAVDDKNESNIVNRVAKERAFSESRVVKILRIWHPSHLSYSSIPTTTSEKQSCPEPQYLSSYLNRITYANNVTLKDKQNYLVRISS